MPFKKYQFIIKECNWYTKSNLMKIMFFFQWLWAERGHDPTQFPFGEYETAASKFLVWYENTRQTGREG